MALSSSVPQIGVDIDWQISGTDRHWGGLEYGSLSEAEPINHALEVALVKMVEQVDVVSWSC